MERIHYENKDQPMSQHLLNRGQTLCLARNLKRTACHNTFLIEVKQVLEMAVKLHLDFMVTTPS